jgi:hypothetical protein
MITLNDYNNVINSVTNKYKYSQFKKYKIPKKYIYVEDKKGNTIKTVVKDRIGGSRNFWLPLYVKKGSNITYVCVINRKKRETYVKLSKFIKIRKKIQKKVITLTKKKPIIDVDRKEYKNLDRLVKKYFIKNNLYITYQGL